MYSIRFNPIRSSACIEVIKLVPVGLLAGAHKRRQKVATKSSVAKSKKAGAVKPKGRRGAARMPALTVVEFFGGWAVASDDATRPLTEAQAYEILTSYGAIQKILNGQS
jgi:hypothetical protein